ncbi:MAG: DUF2807 domain-containing protein, partial [Bacteroidales bacterium]|nr:DUF2807 domain-containing protein [Bacteroidales bacterium]
MLQILRTSGLVLAMIAMVTVSFASEKAEKETRQLDSFTKLSLSGDLVINLTDGYKNEVSIIGTETERNNVATELVNGIMKIYLKEELNDDSKVYVYLTVSGVEFIQVANGAKLSSYAPISSSSLQLIGDKSANIDIKVNAEMFRCNLKNGSNAKINGKITTAYMSADNSKLEADIQSVDVTSTAQNKAEMY